MRESQARSALQRLATGQSLAVVKVASGWQGATADNRHTITFWTGSTEWSKAGSSTFPEALDFAAPRLQGRLLSSMSNAVFLAEGSFTADRPSDAVGFARHKGQWSVLLPRGSDALYPAGIGAVHGDGVALQMAFVGDRLQVTDLWEPESHASLEAQLSHPYVRTYRGATEALTQVADNTVAGSLVPLTGLAGAIELPASGPVADGSYVVSSATTDKSGLDLKTLSGAHRSLPLSASYTGRLAALEPGRGSVAVTAPAWVMTFFLDQECPDPSACGPFRPAVSNPVWLDGSLHITVRGGRVTHVRVVPVG